MDVMQLVATLSLDSQDFDKGLKSAESQATGFGSKFVSSFKGISDTFTTAGRQISLFGNNITQIGSTLTSGITQPAVGAAEALGKMFIGAGWNRMNNLDQAKAKMQALGTSAEDVAAIFNGPVTAAVDGTAYSLDAAGTTAAQAMAAGIKGSDELTRYLTNVADTASIAGIGMDEMGAIFNKVATNGKATTEVLNQLSDRGIPIFQWLGEAAGKSGDEIREMVRKGQVDLELFQKAIETHIGGAAQKMGDATIQGALANVRSAIAKIGEAFLGASDDANTFAGQILPLIIQFKDFLNKQVKPAVKDMGLIFGQVFNAVVQYVRTGTVSLDGFSDKAVAVFSKIQPVIDGVRRAFEILSGVSPKVLAVFGGIAVALGPALTFIGQFINGIGVLTTLFGALLSPVGLVVAAIGLLVTAFAMTQAEATGLLGVFQEVGNMIMDFGSKVITYVTDAMNNAAEAISNFDWAEAVGKTLDAIIGFFEGPSALRDMISAAINLMKSLALGLIDAIPVVLERLPQIIGDIIGGLLSIVVEMTDDIGEIGVKLIIAVVEGMAKAIMNLPELLKGIGEGLQDGIYRLFDWDEEKTQAIADDFNQKLAGAVETGQDDLNTAARNSADGFVDEFGNTLDRLPGVVDEKMGTAVDGFTHHAGRFGDVTDEALSRVEEIALQRLDNVNTRLEEKTALGGEIVDENTKRLVEMAGFNFDEMEGTTSEKVQAAMDVLETGILNGNVEAEAALKELNNILNVNWDEIKTAAETAFGEGGIVATILTSWTRIQEETTTTWTAIHEELRSIWSSIQTDFETAFTGLSSGMGTMFNQIVAAARSGMSQVQATFTAGWNTIKSSTATVWQSITQTVTQAITNMRSQIQTAFSAIQRVIEQAWRTVQSKTQSTWNTIRSQLTSIWNGIRSLAQTTFNSVHQVINAAWQNVLNSTRSNWQNVLAVTQSVWGEIVAFLQTTVEEIKAIFTEPDWQEVGAMIIEGVKEGVLSKAGELAEAVMEVVQGALQAAKAALEIMSPSKKFRDEVGKMIMKGMILGIEDEMPNLEAVMFKASETALAISKKMADGIHSLNHALAVEEAKYQQWVRQKEIAAHQKAIEDKYAEIEKTALDAEKEYHDAIEAYNEKRLDAQEAYDKKRRKEMSEEDARDAQEAFDKQARKDEKNHLERLESIREKEIEARDRLHAEIAQLEADWTEQEESRQREAALRQITDRRDYLEQLQKEYDDALSKIEAREASFVEKMTAYGKLFQRVKDEATGEQVFQLGDLQGDIDTLTEYGLALEKLKEKGIPDGLMDEVLSMNIDDALEYMTKLDKMTSKEYDKYIKTWEQKQQLAADISKRFYQSEYDAVNEEFSEKITTGLRLLQEELYNIGMNSVIGMETGMNNELPNLLNVATGIAHKVISAMKAAMGVASPSKVMRDQVGQWISKGIAVGMMDGLPEIEKSMQSIVDTMNLDPQQLQLNVSGDDSMNQGGFVQNVTINAPQQLDAYEVARQTRLATQEFVLAVGRA